MSEHTANGPEKLPAGPRLKLGVCGSVAAFAHAAAGAAYTWQGWQTATDPGAGIVPPQVLEYGWVGTWSATAATVAGLAYRAWRRDGFSRLAAGVPAATWLVLGVMPAGFVRPNEFGLLLPVLGAVIAHQTLKGSLTDRSRATLGLWLSVWLTAVGAQVLLPAASTGANMSALLTVVLGAYIKAAILGLETLAAFTLGWVLVAARGTRPAEPLIWGATVLDDEPVPAGSSISV